jgi:hypothetical protein
MIAGDGVKPSFHIGIAMAGAVSAGAYSAGVFDFLIEALSEWQKAKDKGEDVPKHDVFISVLSGTSAGGITAALGLASLAGGIRSVEEPSVNPRQIRPVKRALPELYDAWVKKTRLFPSAQEKTSKRANSSLLDTGDIEQGEIPPSLLNSTALTRIARESLSAINPSGVRLPYFTNPTHLFLPHTNLDGISYPIAFEQSTYWMNMHEDRAHFAITGLGSRPYPEECRWLAKWGDVGEEIDVANFVRLQGASSDRPLPQPFEAFAQAALTTSAFPFGLQSRQISVETAKLRRRALPFEAGLFPETLAQLKTDDKHFTSHFVCVDGGTLNNEPFELVRWSIRDLNESQNSRDPTTASRAVILIAPFPPQSVSDTKRLGSERGKGDLAMTFVGKALLPALIAQARFKASDLITASDPNVYSRYLIAPSRDKPQSAPPTAPDLACGLLYAFGGFLDEQFREHDFVLGRRNCQWFLRKHFTLHPSNPVFGLDPATIDPSERERPIIPLVGSADTPIEAPLWPQISEHRLDDMRAALEGRLDPFVEAIITQLLKPILILRMAARISWWRRRKELIDGLMKTVRDQLVANGQLQAAQPPSFWARLKKRLRSLQEEEPD